MLSRRSLLAVAPALLLSRKIALASTMGLAVGGGEESSITKGALAVIGVGESNLIGGGWGNKAPTELYRCAYYNEVKFLDASDVIRRGVLNYHRPDLFESKYRALRTDRRQGVGPLGFMADHMVRMLPDGTEVVFASCARGGKGFKYKVPGTAIWSATIARTDLLVSKGAMISCLAMDGGQNDTNTLDDANAIGQQMLDIVGAFRARYGADIPVVICDFQERPPSPVRFLYWDQGRASIDATVPKMGNAKLIATRDYAMMPDHVHRQNDFVTGGANRTVGEVMATSWMALKGLQSRNPLRVRSDP